MSENQSAELLRKAANLMRERAEAATPGPWHEAERLDCRCCVNVRWDSMKVLDASDNDTPHIASWHPAVALAVADWLDNAATLDTIGVNHKRHALAVARAYLGRDA